MHLKESASDCEKYMNILCREIDERCVGSEGNRKATAFFEKEISSFGWKTRIQEFDAIDWIDGGAELIAGKKKFEVFVGPYSVGCNIEAELLAASTVEELENIELKGKIVLLLGEIAKEQLMPKNFVFYNPEEHQKIISLLEKGNPIAIIAATGKNSSTAGGIYPFPLIEDGDFNIPFVYMKDIEGDKLIKYKGKLASLKSNSKRIPGKGYNVIAYKGNPSAKRIVLTAHIDAKKGTPGAIDNATGVSALLLLARFLKDYKGKFQIEIAALNGEDYYAVPGQMSYLIENKNRFAEILLNINIDGAGYKEGPSAFSLFNLPDNISSKAAEIINNFPTIEEGIQWVQGDHSIFIQNGRPAIAVTSQWFLNNINDQDITHTPKDNLNVVNCDRIIEIAKALEKFIVSL